ncbi:Oidioi.mRNA.OKI2018_I69.chr2.g7763.t1.cds [Oikopleura dioica]|uniref:N-acetylgalactosaminide beta-1,3-galactosyltransferase n=1 Tax=Oikopleura dioica TaxID=34765 RepID=A0ABN7T7S1_OIKDI|nr:Oidioi.mRNA.OKI2018_I69.chr2.g7763.t1.cds [Oikopleura dioica]
MTTPEFLRTRVKAFSDTWLRDLDRNDVDVLFFSKPEPGFNTISMADVDDHVYPPQKKSFKMLAFFHDKLIDQYEWFLRLDDDTVIQWENLNLFLARLNSTKPLMIGNPGNQS